MTLQILGIDDTRLIVPIILIPVITFIIYAGFSSDQVQRPSCSVPPLEERILARTLARIVCSTGHGVGLTLPQCRARAVRIRLDKMGACISI